MSSNAILNEIDWDDGFEIPVASEPNKKLENDVRSKKEQLTRQRDEAAIHEKRSQALTVHLSHVQQDLRATVQLLAAKKREQKAESHQRMIADREYGRLKQEITGLKVGLDENHGQKVRFENEINIAKDKVSELKTEIDWDQKKLEHWLDESSKQDDNVLTLHKYMKEDDSKLKQLMLTMERLTEEVRAARRILNDEKTETLSIQICVDKTAEDFRKQQGGREQLIGQWKQTLDQMKKRDTDLAQLDETISFQISELNNEKTNLSIKQNFFEQEEQNNLELERKIEQRTRESAKLVDNVQHAEQEKTQIESEVQTAKFSVERVTTDLESLKAQTVHLQESHEKKETRLEVLKSEKETTKSELSKVEGEQLSAEQKASAAERLLNHEEAIVKNLLDQVKQAREMQFKREQELKKAKSEETVLKNSVNGDLSAMKNLKSRLKQMDAQSLQQQEVIYQQDYQVVNIDRRLGKLQGDGMDQEEKDKLEAKVKALTESLEERQNTKKVVTQQLKKLQDEVRRVNREMEKTDKEYQDLVAKIAEMDLQYESSQRETSNLEKENNNALVDDNLLRLEISRLRGTLAERVNSVVDLSQRRLTLNTAIKERKIQINNMKAMVNAELKALEEERSILSHDLHERINKIQKIRNRYESLMILMASPEGNDATESEETQSQAFYVIKAAQEKEEVQRYGDKLDRDIKQAEAENEALVNTVRLVKAKNKKMHEALSPANDDSSESKELDKKLKAAQEKLKLMKNRFIDEQRQLHELTNAIPYALENENNASSKLASCKNDLDNLDRQILEQKSKFARVEKMLSKIDRSQFSEHQNLDLDLKEARSLITGAGRQLNQILKTQDEIMSIAGSLMMQVGIEPDLVFSRSSTTGFSRASSSTSSKQVTPRSGGQITPTKALTLTMDSSNGRPPSAASGGSRASFSSVRSGTKVNVKKKTPVSSPLASARSSAGSGLSLTGSRISKK